MTPVTLFASVFLSCLLVFAHAGSETVSECPEFDCKEPKCWRALTSPQDTYLYLEDGTRCPGCKTCVMNRPLNLEGACPPMACPMWRLPASCQPEFYSLKMEYKGNECSACDTYVCTGDMSSS